MGRIINIIKITDNSGLIDILTDHLRDADSPLSFQKIIPEPNDPMRFPEGISEAQRRAWRSYAWGTPDEPTHVAMNLLRYDNDETSYRYVFTTNDYPPSADLIQGISNMVPRPQWAGSLKIETTAYDPKSETVRIQRWKNDEMVDQVVDKMTDDEQRFIQQYDDGVYDNYYAVFRRDGDKVKASDVINDIEIKFRYKQDNYAIRNAVESETSDFDFNKIVPEPKTLTEDNQQERLIWKKNTVVVTCQHPEGLSVPLCGHAP